jgi:hypothetical protein
VLYSDSLTVSRKCSNRRSGSILRNYSSQDAGAQAYRIKSVFVLLALAFWVLACPASPAEDDDDPNTLNQQVNQLIEQVEQGKYQEAIPFGERAVKVAKRVRPFGTTPLALP